MFDTLVESTKRKTGKRASRYFVVTTAIYAVALFALGVGTIIGFSPALAEEHSLIGMLAPPLPDNSPPPTKQPNTVTNVRPDVSAGFVAPVKTPDEIPNPLEVKPGTIKLNGPVIFDPAFPITNIGGKGVGIGASKDSIPDPPPPPDIKKIPPTPTPEVKQGPAKVSEGVLQGSAIRKQRPTYPPIARAARVSGPVQVVVTISEQGRVIEAYAANGHPMLRQAAIDAARQWLFTPTTLSKVPVRVQGMLTFNFVLE